MATDSINIALPSLSDVENTLKTLVGAHLGFAEGDELRFWEEMQRILQLHEKTITNAVSVEQLFYFYTFLRLVKEETRFFPDDYKQTVIDIEQTMTQIGKSIKARTVLSSIQDQVLVVIKNRILHSIETRVVNPDLRTTMLEILQNTMLKRFQNATEQLFAIKISNRAKTQYLELFYRWLVEITNDVPEQTNQATLIPKVKFIKNAFSKRLSQFEAKIRSHSPPVVLPIARDETLADPPPPSENAQPQDTPPPAPRRVIEESDKQSIAHQEEVFSAFDELKQLNAGADDADEVNVFLEEVNASIQEIEQFINDDLNTLTDEVKERLIILGRLLKRFNDSPLVIEHKKMLFETIDQSIKKIMDGQEINTEFKVIASCIYQLQIQFVASQATQFFKMIEKEQALVDVFASLYQGKINQLEVINQLRIQIFLARSQNIEAALSQQESKLDEVFVQLKDILSKNVSRLGNKMSLKHIEKLPANGPTLLSVINTFGNKPKIGMSLRPVKEKMFLLYLNAIKGNIEAAQQQSLDTLPAIQETLAWNHEQSKEIGNVRDEYLSFSTGMTPDELRVFTKKPFNAFSDRLPKLMEQLQALRKLSNHKDLLLNQLTIEIELYTKGRGDGNLPFKQMFRAWVSLDPADPSQRESLQPAFGQWLTKMKASLSTFNDEDIQLLMEYLITLTEKAIARDDVAKQLIHVAWDYIQSSTKPEQYAIGQKQKMKQFYQTMQGKYAL